MCRVGLILLCLALSPLARAEERPLALALSGGGAAGLAHVGVIRELEARGIRPDCVAGTSMGAIVGGLYAAGYSAAELERLVVELDWLGLLNDNADRSQQHPARRRSRSDPLDFMAELPLRAGKDGVKFDGGLIDAARLSIKLRELTSAVAGIEDFDALPIPFRAVATDLSTGEAVVLDRGDLGTALRASMSIPGLFPAVSHEGRLLVDGGVVDNLPIAVARRLCGGKARVIAVNLPAPKQTPDKLGDLGSVLAQTMSLFIARSVREQIATLEAGDVLIVPAVEEIGMLDFHRTREALKIGGESARRQLAGLDLPARRDVFEVAVRAPDAVSYEAIEIINTSTLSERSLRAVLDLPDSGKVDTLTLEDRMARVRGLGGFESVTWRLVVRDRAPVLVITAQARQAGPSDIRVGLSLEDNFQGDANFVLAAETQLANIGQDGGRARMGGAIGSFRLWEAEYLHPLREDQTLFLRPSLRAAGHEFDSHVGSADAPLSRIDQRDLTAGVGMTWTPDSATRLDGSLLLREAWVKQDGLRRNAAPVEFRLRLALDTLNDANFPTHGSAAELQFQTGVTDDAAMRLSWDLIAARDFNGHILTAFARGSGNLGGDDDWIGQNSVGGFQNLSGLPRDALSGEVAAMAGLRYLHRLQPFGTAISLYAGASAEVGGVWSGWRELGEDLVTAGSIFLGTDTPFGPLTLGMGFSTEGAAAYFALGRKF